jgi:D-alanyl-lipoteichoic acid acyltransferase DltB (MBOAT superfamily)
MENFKQPYLSKNFKDFWSRWHISLSSWFRDYLYIPLGGSRCSGVRHLINLWIVFLVSGIWHGASWNFILWGALHGLMLSFESTRLWKKLWPSGALGTIFTFGCVSLFWIPFRLQDLGQLDDFMVNLLNFSNWSVPWGRGVNTVDYVLAVMGVMLWVWVEILLEPIKRLIQAKPRLSVCFLSICGWMMIFIFAVDQKEFIYFQF